MENKQHITVTTALIPYNVELVDQRHLFRNSLESGAAESKEKWGVKHTHMASAGARAYNGGLGAEPPAGVQGAEPPVGVKGQSPPEAEVFCV